MMKNSTIPQCICLHLNECMMILDRVNYQESYIKVLKAKVCGINSLFWGGFVTVLYWMALLTQITLVSPIPLTINRLLSA